MALIKKSGLGPSASASRPALVLLGDGTLDNSNCVASVNTVESRLKNMVPDNLAVARLAAQGSRLADVKSQLAMAPQHTRYIIVSTGSVDGQDYEQILFAKYASSAEMLRKLYDIRQEYMERYGAMMDAVLKAKIPAVFCTLYMAQRQNKTISRVMMAATSMFNDAIVVCARERQVPLIDMRGVCAKPGDIHPSLLPTEAGGEKIAKTILKTLYSHDFSKKQCSLYGWR